MVCLYLPVASSTMQDTTFAITALPCSFPCVKQPAPQLSRNPESHLEPFCTRGAIVLLWHIQESKRRFPVPRAIITSYIG